MIVSNVVACPNEDGHLIDLAWKNPSLTEFPDFDSVKVVRRERAFPRDETDGEVRFVGDTASENFQDSGLKGQTIYYYTVFAVDNSAAQRHFAGKSSRASAMATSNYASSVKLYDLLPGIYQRFDTALPEPGTVANKDENKGELQRLLEIFGPQLDLLRSFIAAATDLHDVQRTDGDLLPLLAQWIGWQTNFGLDLDSQRNEIRYAPHFYRTIGLAPNLQALINRLTNWQCQVKEFHQNVFRTSTPPALTTWLQENVDGNWEPPASFVLDTVFEGRPASLQAADGTTQLFYHAQTTESSDIWYKMLIDGQWQPANRLTDGRSFNKYPEVTQTDDGQIHLFWSKRQNGIWQLFTSRYNGVDWSEEEALEDLGGSFSDIEPSAFADPQDSSALWLFWSSLRSGRWRVWYSRFDGVNWASPRQLTDGSGNDRKPSAIIFDTTHPTDKIWVFWTRNGDAGYELVYRTKPDLDVGTDNWNPEVLLSNKPGNARFDDTEPSVLKNPDEDLELYFRSNRTGSDNIWTRTYRKSDESWQAEEQITVDAAASQAPEAVYLTDNRVLLWYRSTRTIAYTSQFNSAAQTLDHRYAGATTLNTRNLDRVSRRESFEDDQTYIYDTGKGERDWYARDTIGLYLTPDTEDQQLIRRFRQNLQAILPRFLPLQLRAVVILNPPVYNEIFYTYDFPEVQPQRLIESSFRSAPGDIEVEPVGPITAEHIDLMQTWRWFRTWSDITPDSRTGDLGFRTFFPGIDEGDN